MLRAGGVSARSGPRLVLKPAGGCSSTTARPLRRNRGNGHRWRARRSGVQRASDSCRRETERERKGAGHLALGLSWTAAG